MAGVDRRHKVADMHRIEGPPEDAKSPGATHARSVARSHRPAGTGAALLVPRGRIGPLSPRTLVG